MKSFKDIRFYYYWSKGEKALKDGDEKTANKCKKKLIRLYPKNWIMRHLKHGVLFFLFLKGELEWKYLIFVK